MSFITRFMRRALGLRPLYSDGRLPLFKLPPPPPAKPRPAELYSDESSELEVSRYQLISDCAKCRDCQDPVHDFLVPDAVWAELVGEEIVLCWDCLADRANQKGIWMIDGPYPPRRAICGAGMNYTCGVCRKVEHGPGFGLCDACATEPLKPAEEQNS